MASFDQALKQQQSGRLIEAERLYREVLAADSRNFDALHMLGVVCTENGKIDDAEKSFRAAIAIDPRYPPCFHNFGLHLAKRGQYVLAIEQFDRALALFPKYAPVHSDRGCALMELGRLDDALASHDRAAALAPDVAPVWYNRANTLARKREFIAALKDYQRAIACKADYPDAWVGIGHALCGLDRHEEALAAYDRALALDPGLAQAFNGRGNALNELRRYDDAIEAFDKAVALKPDLADAYYNQSLILLSLHDYGKGWPAYEWRSSNSEFGPMLPYLTSLNVSTCVDRGTLIGKTVAVLAEQGVGDEIMFASILPDLERDAKAVRYEVDPRLIRLFRTSFANVAFVPRRQRDVLDQQKFDVVLQAGSLGYAYRRTVESFPRRPYLAADAARVAHWRAALEGVGAARAKIGISWRGGTVTTKRNHRSVDLEQLTPLIARSDCCFVNLQYGDVEGDISSFNARRDENRLHRLLDDFNDFDGFAALVTALDLVITVQNTTIHMCGALGEPCWGLLPWRPEWRYGAFGHSMDWYSSVKLFRQDSPNDWAGLISNVSSQLTKFVLERRAG